ncbi:IS701 family transposase [Kineococcus sp. SYSU DK005]|uniref:IS701 family transposase n=1 Tax=Kineococcus sp. SYSU DK005 TaxID=3383126 RepID=UPI003D7D96EF
MVVDTALTELDRLHARIASRFARAEPRARVRTYVAGLAAGLERKNGWTLAEQAGEVSPDGMQRLLRKADWDVGGVRDDVRDHVVQHLGSADGVLIVDETGFLKKGLRSAGVQRQYSGTAGRIENSQIGTFLAYASARGHALIDRELYLPRSWTQDRDRCRAAGVPDDVEFATKTVQARQMIARALAADVPFAWVTADEVYGQDTELRLWLENQDVAHVLSCKSSQTIITAEATWRRAAELIAELPARAWRSYSTGAGAHGERISEWARVPIRVAWRAGRGHWLLARRSISSGELAYYLCYGPRGTSLAELARIAGSRWRIEECFQQAKNEAGLDQYQVRDYRAWYAHIPPQAGGAPSLSMLTLAWLSATRSQLAGAAEKGGAEPVVTT